MPPLSRQDRQDLNQLQGVIEAIGRVLHWLVWDSAFIPAALQRDFATVFGVLSGRLPNAIRQLESIQSTEDELWKRLDDAGLIGAPLHLKLELWRRTASALSPAAPPSGPPPPPPAGFIGRRLRPLLNQINHWLGSLAEAFPPLHAVKEFKEGTELVVDDQQAGEPPPGSILGVRDA